MQKTSLKNVKVLACAAMLVAMNIVLSRVLSIKVGETIRITFSQVPIYLCSLWFGPIVGGISGLAGDMLGCFMTGYAPNPLLSVSAVLTGVIPAVMSTYVFKKNLNWWKIAIMLAVNGLLGSMGFTIIGLHLLTGQPWTVLYVSRLLQTVTLTVTNTILVTILYKSALTGFVQQNILVNAKTR